MTRIFLKQILIREICVIRGRFSRFTQIERRFISQRLGWDFRCGRAVVQDAHHAVASHPSDLRARHIPFLKNSPNDVFLPAARDDQHALLRFAQENFVGRHARLALRHFGEIDFHAGAAAAGGFTGRTGEPGRTHVLDTGHGIGREQFETRFEEQLLFEWIAHLNRGAVFARFLGQFARCECCSRQSVTTRFRADIKDRIAHPAGRAARQLLMPQDAKAKNVDQRIALETFVEIDLAADRWDADAVPVVRDTGNHTGEEPPVGGDLPLATGDRPKPQRVEQKLRSRAHGKDVPNDATDTRRRALERLDRARMIVALDLERDRPPITDIDDPGVFFPCFDQDVRPAGGKFLQLFPRILIRTVLAPHDRENPELGKVRFASENFLDALKFISGQPVFRNQIGRDWRIDRLQRKSDGGHVADD